MGMREASSAGAVACLLAALIVVGLAVPAAALPVPGIPQEGPDIPRTTGSVTSVTAFLDEPFSGWEGARWRTIQVPASWDRAVLILRIEPAGDPWDRLFAVAIGSVEVLHGTTPRADMTIKKDVTEFGALLPPGGTADVGLYLSTWVGAMLGTVRLEFYHDEPTAAAVARPADAAVGAFLWEYMGGSGSTRTRTVQFPSAAPSAGILELTTSGHYPCGEFWYINGRPSAFTVRVDGEDVGAVVALPYVYALVGFEGSFGELVHPYMWWTAQWVADILGVHTGDGEIPPYRIALAPDILPLLAGARTVELVQPVGCGVWVTSVSFLLTS